MDTKQLQSVLRQAGSVVLLNEESQPTAVVVSWESWMKLTKSESQSEAPVQEVPISSRWPKAARPAVVTPDQTSKQDLVLERLNKEILALKAQIEQEEALVQ